jgi:hypothetical protein
MFVLAPAVYLHRGLRVYSSTYFRHLAMSSSAMNLRIITRLSAAVWLFQSTVAVIDVSTFAANDVIVKDVAIIGGGASGSHAAVRLREDFGKTLVVVEKQNQLV